MGEFYRGAVQFAIFLIPVFILRNISANFVMGIGQQYYAVDKGQFWP